MPTIFTVTTLSSTYRVTLDVIRYGGKRQVFCGGCLAPVVGGQIEMTPNFRKMFGDVTIEMVGTGAVQKG
jgi:hypothetical protein